MPAVSKYLPLLAVALAGLLLVVGLPIWLAYPAAEPLPAEGAAAAVSAAPDQAAARDYRPIARLFPRPLPPARPADPAIPAAVAAPPTPPVRQAPVLSLRYMGSSVDENGARTYYIRNETTGRRLNVGEGRNDDGIEFVGERDGAIVLRIDGFEYTVRK